MDRQAIQARRDEYEKGRQSAEANAEQARVDVQRWMVQAAAQEGAVVAMDELLAMIDNEAVPPEQVMPKEE